MITLSMFKSSYHNMSFSMDTEKEIKLNFLEIEVILKQGKSKPKIYQKPIFSGVWSKWF